MIFLKKCFTILSMPPLHYAVGCKNTNFSLDVLDGVVKPVTQWKPSYHLTYFPILLFIKHVTDNRQLNEI